MTFDAPVTVSSAAGAEARAPATAASVSLSVGAAGMTSPLRPVQGRRTKEAPGNQEPGSRWSGETLLTGMDGARLSNFLT